MNGTTALLFLFFGLVGLVLFGLLAKARALSPLTWAGILIGSGVTSAFFALVA